jgi:hypothetical protein
MLYATHYSRNNHVVVRKWIIPRRNHGVGGVVRPGEWQFHWGFVKVCTHECLALDHETQVRALIKQTHFVARKLESGDLGGVSGLQYMTAISQPGGLRVAA